VTETKKKEKKIEAIGIISRKITSSIPDEVIAFFN
jgi:hypothetical protein